VLGGAGLGWYEVSNWSRGEHQRARHNEGYWLGHDWWGIGPGAHSHVGGTRWWNVRHPVAYAARLAVDESPAQGREVLTPEQRQVERVLLGIRLREGHPLADVIYPDAAVAMVDEGLLDKVAFDVGRLALTLPGRLLADAVVRRLV
jgi:coproporphyrinogen III oxidase-like Fe-S oxidoreductase